MIPADENRRIGTLFKRGDFLKASLAYTVLQTDASCADSFEGRIAKLKNQILEAMRGHKVPGTSIALIREGRLFWSQGFGVCDRHSMRKVDSNTIFEAASMSKPVFAYAVLKLCERNVLDLDRPLTSYTKNRFLEGDARLDQITSRHALSHTTGFQAMRSGSIPLKIQRDPGSKWEYSGEGYAYLQSVVSELTGRTDESKCNSFENELRVCATNFDIFMRDYVLLPLGMKSSGYLLNKGMNRKIASGHDAEGNPLKAAEKTSAGVARYGAMGGLLTSAADYVRFLICMMDQTSGDPHRLTEASLREMVRPVVKISTAEDYEIWWALGWRVAKTARFGELVSHGGDQLGFHSNAEFSRASRSGFVIFTNGDNGWRLVQQVSIAVSEWIHEPGKR